MPQIGGFVSLKTFLFLLMLILGACVAGVGYFFPSWLASIVEWGWNTLTPGIIGATL